MRELEFQRHHDFNKKYSKPMPDFSKFEEEVKRNINQILREQHVLVRE